MLAAFDGSAETLTKASLPIKQATTSRNEILLDAVPRTAHNIEIGPSYNPTAPKAQSWNTRSLDHTTREGPIAKYRGHTGVDVSRIEEGRHRLNWRSVDRCGPRRIALYIRRLHRQPCDRAHTRSHRLLRAEFQQALFLFSERNFFAKAAPRPLLARQGRYFDLGAAKDKVRIVERIL